MISLTTKYLRISRFSVKMLVHHTLMFGHGTRVHATTPGLNTRSVHDKRLHRRQSKLYKLLCN